MNKETLQGQRAYFKMVHGVTLRLIGCFSDADLDHRPQSGMRSVRDLIMHMYGMQKVWAEDIRKPRITPESENRSIPETAEGKAEAAKLKTVVN
ncbi:MAG: DinB family protein, partial [Blastocatellia bacterium]